MSALVKFFARRKAAFYAALFATIFFPALTFGQLALSKAGTDQVPKIPEGELVLSGLGQIFAADTRPLELHLCFAGSGELDDMQIARGAAVSQAIALRAGYRPVYVSYGVRPVANKFNILVGTVTELGNQLSESDAKKIQHGYLGLRRFGPSNSYLLIVSGRTSQDLDSAVVSLGLVRETLPKTAGASIKEVILPAAAPFYRRSPLESDNISTFGELQKNGAEVAAIPTGGLTIDLFLPAYLQTESEALAKLDIYYEMPVQAFRASSGMKVTLNGKPLTLSAPQRANAGGMEVTVNFPVNMMLPGRNTLAITGSNGLQVQADSTLSLPIMEGEVKLPDLRITTRTFFPFVGQPDGSELAVVLANRSPEVIQSAWTFLARLAQSANTFFYAAQFTFEQPDVHRHVVVVGTRDTLPVTYRNMVNADVFEPAYVPILENPADKAASGVNLKQYIQSRVHPKSAIPENVVEKVKPGVKAADVYGYLVSHPPLAETSGWILVLSSTGDGKVLLDRTKRLITREYWDQVEGDSVRWETEPASLEAHIPGTIRPQAVMDLGTVEFLFGGELSFSNWVMLVVGMLLFWVMLSVMLLKKFDQVVMIRERSLK